jgi:hypothetical protein
MIGLDPVPQFPLGEIVVTPGAAMRLDPRDVQASIARHTVGDWGELESEDMVKGLHKSIDSQIELARDLEVDHAIALMESGKAKFVRRMTGTTLDSIRCRRTMPGPTEDNWSMSPTKSRLALTSSWIAGRAGLR